jgi:hypothetical protein
MHLEVLADLFGTDHVEVVELQRNLDTVAHRGLLRLSAWSLTTVGRPLPRTGGPPPIAKKAFLSPPSWMLVDVDVPATSSIDTMCRSLVRPAPDSRGLRPRRIHRKVYVGMRAYELMVIIDGDLAEPRSPRSRAG